MASSFARSNAGSVEVEADGRLFSVGLRAGLSAGVEDLRGEVLKCLCG